MHTLESLAAQYIPCKAFQGNVFLPRSCMGITSFQDSRKIFARNVLLANILQRSHYRQDSSEKPSGQGNLSLLNVFNILSHHPIENLINGIENAKYRKVCLQFFHFWGHFWVNLGSLWSTKTSKDL